MNVLLIFLILCVFRTMITIGIILIATDCVICTIHKLLQHVSANTYRHLHGEKTKVMFSYNCKTLSKVLGIMYILNLITMC